MVPALYALAHATEFLSEHAGAASCGALKPFFGIGIKASHLQPFEPSLITEPSAPMTVAKSPIKAGADVVYAQICHSFEACEPEGSPAEILNEIPTISSVKNLIFLYIFISPLNTL